MADEQRSDTPTGINPSNDLETQRLRIKAEEQRVADEKAKAKPKAAEKAAEKA